MVDLANGNGQGQESLRPRCGVLGVKCVYVFVPLPDITPFELAESVELLQFGIVGQLHGVPPSVVDAIADHLTDGARRHWATQELSQVAVPNPGARGLTLPPGAR